MARIGVYLGTNDDNTANVARVIEAWGEYLSPSYDLEAFGSASLPQTAQQYYTHIKMNGGKSYTPFDKLLSCYRECRAYIDRRNPDLIIQLWKYKSHAPGVTLAAVSRNIQSMIRYTGDTFNEYKHVPWPKKAVIFALDHIIGRLPLYIANGAVALGPYGQRCITTRGAKSNQTYIVPPPLDFSEKFTPPENKSEIRRNLGLPVDQDIALFVGRLTRLKGMNFLRTVIKQVSNQDVVFILVGDGPYKEKFASEFSNENIKLPGYVPHKHIHSYYQASDVYVHPSPYEGVPLVLLEALQCGVPIVARSAGDIELLTDQTFENPALLADHLSRKDWNYQWKNKKHFEPGFQKQRLTGLIESILKSS